MWLWKQEIVSHFRDSDDNNMSFFSVLSVTGPSDDKLSECMRFVVGDMQDDELGTEAGDSE